MFIKNLTLKFTNLSTILSLLKPLYIQVLGDDDKRREYDTFGSAASQMGGGTGGFSQQQANPFGSSGFHYQASVDPEELFRKIFGDFGSSFGEQKSSQDFAESQFGFGAAEEVCFTSRLIFL